MARTRSPALTDAEARLMSVLWQKGRATVAEVVKVLRSSRPVNYSTVQTIMRILEAKGHVAHEKVGRAFVYRPIINKEQARRRALSHLLARFFDNSPSLLVLNVLEDQEMDRGELTRLKKMIEDA
jgi:predicted transcriptional regulator